MAKEAEQEVGAAAEPCEAAIGLLANLRLGLRRRTLHTILDVAMTALLGVQLRGVRWQPLHVDLGVLREEGFDHGGAVGLQPVPDEDLRPADLATEVLQVRDRVLAVDRVVEMLLVDTARRSQPDRRGDLAPLAHTPQLRRPPLGGPRRAGPDLEREPRLIDEDDHGVPAASFFLMRGQSRSSQARISFSSRSAARTAGTWALHPRSLSRVER